jgi:citrate synthase
VAEEQQSPSGRYIWETIDHAIPYVGAGKTRQGEGQP